MVYGHSIFLPLTIFSVLRVLPLTCGGHRHPFSLFLPLCLTTAIRSTRGLKGRIQPWKLQMWSFHGWIWPSKAMVNDKIVKEVFSHSYSLFFLLRNKRNILRKKIPIYNLKPKNPKGENLLGFSFFFYFLFTNF